MTAEEIDMSDNIKTVEGGIDPFNQYDVGLTLGKFAPLHKGHEHLIETAMAECDEVIVVVYDCPETTNVPLQRRANWIRNKFAFQNMGTGITVLEGWTLPTGIGYSDHMKGVHEKAIVDLLQRRDYNPDSIEAFYSSEEYGEHMAGALNATNRLVDPPREEVPISGTKVREDPYVERAFVSDDVYRDLVTNVAIMGGPSTGKTTLTHALADTYRTTFMYEYGRKFWAENSDEDGRLTEKQLATLARKHIKLEDEALTEANGYLFTDTTPITTWSFSKYYHNKADVSLTELAYQCQSRYDVVLVCDPDIPYEDTPDREGKENRERLHKMQVGWLNEYNIPYHVVSGDVAERVEQARTVLDSFEKYDSEIV